MAKTSKEALRRRTKRNNNKLFGLSTEDVKSQNNKSEVVKELSSKIAMIPIAQIERNGEQPRVDFNDDALEELAASIKTLGIIQPLTVRRLADKQYQLISGERRFRASKLIALAEVPAYIRLADDQQMLEMALVENIQRENLNPVEIATTYQRLKTECKLKDDELAARVGKKRSTITNYLGILMLPPKIQQGLKLQILSVGHAKALKGIGDPAEQIALYDKTINEGLSVRALEQEVRKLKEAQSARPTNNKVVLPDGYSTKQSDLREFLGTKVQLKVNKEGKGQIIIPFMDVDDFNRILEVIDL
ncbi:MAG: ParB/RepB/Spo0J family partition protein [Bacteroidota bacterium]